MKPSELGEGRLVERRPNQFRADKTRSYGIDAQTLTGIVHRRTSRQAEDAMLGRGVRRGTGPGDTTQNLGHVDDGPRAGILHCP